MYTYYVLRGTQAGEALEYEGDLDAEDFPGVDLDNGPAIINHLVQKLSQETGKTESVGNTSRPTTNLCKNSQRYV